MSKQICDIIKTIFIISNDCKTETDCYENYKIIFKSEFNNTSMFEFRNLCCYNVVTICNVMYLNVKIVPMISFFDFFKFNIKNLF